jgi:oxygen-independent coproporphyrinogen-3 oxidase
VELPYIAAVLKEWKMYVELFPKRPKIKELHLGGGTPTFFSSTHLELLIEGILQHATIADEADFSFEGHPNNTTEEHLRVLYTLGFKRISFGIQDFDPLVQETINRKQTYGQVEYITDLARMIGYTSINFDIVYGLPKQSLSGLIHTIEKCILLRPDRIAFYSYAHVPWLKPGQRKFTEEDLPVAEHKRALYETGRYLLENAGYVEIGMDHFALPSDPLYVARNNKTLHRNFMGYVCSPTDLLLGLGCSSISDIGLAYAQNTKTVEVYMEAVHENRLPVFNGHLMREEDIHLKNHILNLSCNLETSWKNREEEEAIRSKLHRLEEMASEGLVIINENSLQVTEKGKPFIRNICSMLDGYLHKKDISQVPTFSKAI